jgi:hypothetical protein
VYPVQLIGTALLIGVIIVLNLTKDRPGEASPVTTLKLAEG